MEQEQPNGPVAADDRILDVGVVIVTYNSASFVAKLISTFEEGLRGLRWRALFVDNASNDGTPRIVRDLGHEVIQVDSNRGYAAAINVGSRRFPTARSILVLNPDVELTAGCVARMVSVLDDPGVGVVAPKTYVPGPPPRLEHSQRHDPSLRRTWATALLGARIAGRFDSTFEAVTDPARYEVACDVDWAVGAILLCSRRCVDAVGDWDETYFLYSEETDYCQRVRRAGFTVRYTPLATVLHPSGEGLTNPRLRAMMAVNRVRYYRRGHSAAGSWFFYSGCVVHELVRGLAGRPAARAAARALLFPRRRPIEIHASASRLPM